MRIIIDLQEIQPDYENNDAMRLITLAATLLQQADSHDIKLLLSGLYIQSILFLQSFFKDRILKKNILIWYPPEPTTPVYVDTSLNNHVSELLFSKTIAEQRPDWVLTFKRKDLNKNKAIDAFVSCNLQVPTAIVCDNYPHDYSLLLNSCPKELQRKVAVMAGCFSNSNTDILSLSKDAHTRTEILLSTLEKNCFSKSKEAALQRSTTSKLKLAYFLPSSPEGNKIPHYNAELLKNLTAYYEIDIISASENISASRIQEDYLIHNIPWFEEHHTQYDRILYHFGNACFYRPMVDILQKAPGIVVLHDFFLFDIAPFSNTQSDIEAELKKILYHSHGYKAVQECVQDTALTSRYPCNLHILQKAIGVIVSSKDFLKLAQHWYGNTASEDWAIISDPYAPLFYESIERFYEQHFFSLPKLIAAIDMKKETPLSKGKVMDLSNCLARNFPPKPKLKQLFVDVSAIAQQDFKTGIQRVIRSQLLRLIASPPDGFRIEPVYLTQDNSGQWCYHYAYQYIYQLLNIQSLPPSFDRPIDFYYGDVLYIPDLACNPVILAHKSGLFKKLRTTQVSIIVLLHDILPITHPDFFPLGTAPIFLAWLKSVIEFSDKIICVSQNTENELKIFMQAKGMGHNVTTQFLHHGADIIASYKTVDLTDKTISLLNKIQSKKSFLITGTVEPRKGHSQVLGAFEILWKKGLDVSLVIVGKQGWMIEKLAQKIKQHKELDNRLFWLEDANDAVLSKLYHSCTALIMASEAEGFGLPLIEAAQHSLPLIVRDIPVFKEISGSHAFYFTGAEPNDLALAIQEWLGLYSMKKIPISKHLQWMTWNEQVEQLKQQLIY